MFNTLPPSKTKLFHSELVASPPTFGLRLMIPDNPEVCSERLFEYQTKRDALSFCWTATNTILKTVNNALGYLVGGGN